MAMALYGLAMICSLVSIVCWILTLVKMFGDQEKGGVLHGIIGIICGLYALIWGWMNHAQHNHKTIMMVWTGVIVASIVLQVAAGAMMASQMTVPG